MNYAAFIDECMNGKNSSTTEMGNSTFLNFCNVNMNTHPFASPDIMYNPFVLLTAYIELHKQQLRMELTTTMSQLLVSNNNSSIMNNINTTLNNSETLPNENSSYSNPLGSDEKKLFPTKPFEGLGTSKNEFDFAENYESHEERSSNNTQIRMSQENIDANNTEIANDEEFTARHLHDTNPFKQDFIGNSNGGVDFRKAPSSNKIFQHNDNVMKPPIPPRNPNLINKTGNLTSSANCNQQKNSTTQKIYYEAGPVMYNLNTVKTDEANSTLRNGTAKLKDSVSFQSNNHYDMVNSSQDITSHPSTTDASFNFGRTNTLHCDPNSLQSGLDSQLNTTKTNNIFTPNTTFGTNHTQYLGPRISPNNYRPPPPPYRQNNSAEYPYKTKSPISPRFTTPVLSENSKAAIEAIQSAANVSFYDILDSAATEIPGSTERDMTSENLGTFEGYATSSPITNNNISSATTIPESTLYYQNPIGFDTSYKKNFISPTFLQEKQSTESLRQNSPDTSHGTEVLSGVSERTSSNENTRQIFATSEQNSSVRKESNTTMPWAEGHQASYNLNGASSGNSERSEIDPYSFGTENLDMRKKDDASSTIPTPHSQQSSVNEQHSSQRDYDNCSITFKGDITVENEHSKFSNNKPGHSTPSHFSHPHQPQPPIARHYQPIYPNIGPLQHGTNYPYHMPQPEQHPQLGPRIPPLFDLNVRGFYPAPVQWSRPQFFNPAFPYPRHHGPPLNPHPYHWNPYNPRPFIPMQTGHQYRTAMPNSQTNSQTDFGRDSVSPELNHAHTLGQENRENINIVKKEETPIDATKLTEHTTDQSDSLSMPCRTPKESTNSVLNNTSNLKDSTPSTQLDVSNTRKANPETEEFFRESTATKEELNGKQNTTALPSTNDSKVSSNPNFSNTPQHTKSEDVPNIITPIEVNNQTIHMLDIANQGWACTDEIALVFTSFENRHTILRILDIEPVSINFMEISRAQSPFLFSQLESTTVRVPRMANSKRIKGILHLTPLNSLVQMMYHLRIVSLDEIVQWTSKEALLPNSRLPEVVKLIKAYDESKDKY